MSTFLTADLHFGHASIINNCSRPFDSVKHMDEALVERWNNVVHPKDHVWVLGDFSIGHDERTVARLFHALNGHKKLVIGNHDTDNKGNLVKSVARLPWATAPVQRAEIKHDGRRIDLCHYAGMTWNAEHHGCLQAFGHSHGRLLGLPGSVDVGVDAQNYAPVSVEDFVWQADESLRHGEERILQIAEALMNKAHRYAEKVPSAKGFRS